MLISKALIDSHISHDQFVSVKKSAKRILWNKRRSKKSWNLCKIHYIKMVDISSKTYEYKNLRKITTKYYSNQRKYRYELVQEQKKQCNRIFIDEKLAVKVILDCTATSFHKLRTRLGFKQHNAILTKEQSVLTKIISLFEGENIQTQYNF